MAKNKAIVYVVRDSINHKPLKATTDKYEASSFWYNSEKPVYIEEIKIKLVPNQVD